VPEHLPKRCRRICGAETPDCFAANGGQLSCLSDMIVNSACGISSLLEMTKAETPPDIMRENLKEALLITKELVNWVKYLQITHDLRQMVRLSFDRADERKETRYPLPEAFQAFILLEVAAGSMTVPVVLTNFSMNGIQFQSPQSMERDTNLECFLRAKHMVGKEVRFKTSVKYCKGHDEAFLVGAEIEEVSDASDFNFFLSVFDFIKDISPWP
jgi:hypothetical protein